jgi:hypothetical protein
VDKPDPADTVDRGAGIVAAVGRLALDREPLLVVVAGMPALDRESPPVAAADMPEPLVLDRTAVACKELAAAAARLMARPLALEGSRKARLLRSVRSWVCWQEVWEYSFLSLHS